jgi:hypothetical protein
MIEHTDITILGTATLKNKLGIINREQLATAEADLTAFRLAELRTAPIRAGFDSAHFRKSITMFTKTSTIGPDSCAAWTPATDPRLMLPRR